MPYYTTSPSKSGSPAYSGSPTTFGRSLAAQAHLAACRAVFALRAFPPIRSAAARFEPTSMNKKIAEAAQGDSGNFGSPAWARTTDRHVNSVLLYQLSYRGLNL
jgi:hypothetical protein